MADSVGQKKQLSGQEKTLADYMRRLEKQRQGRSAVQVRLSALMPSNRRDRHLRAAASNFEPMIKALAGHLFLLKNGDILFFFKNEVRGEAETTVQQVKHMFSNDPMVADEEQARTAFARWYDAVEDFEEIRRIVQTLAGVEDHRAEKAKSRMDSRASLRTKQTLGEPLTPEVLARIENALSRADLSNLVRRQFACSLDTDMVPTQQFSELFVSIQDLRETLLPGVNLLSNRWLFQHLTETLDRRMLSMLSKTDRIAISGEISLNINIRTLMTDEFIKFDDDFAAQRRGSMIIELQKEDIFSDLGSYLFVRDFVQSKGYRVGIDGMTLETMQLIDFRRLGADMIKLIWDEGLVDGGENVHARIRQLVNTIGGKKVVLCRCDNREAVDFGRTVGIRIFQGRYIKDMLAESGQRRDLINLKRRVESTEERIIEEIEDEETRA